MHIYFKTCAPYVINYKFNIEYTENKHRKTKSHLNPYISSELVPLKPILISLSEKMSNVDEEHPVEALPPIPEDFKPVPWIPPGYERPPPGYPRSWPWPPWPTRPRRSPRGHPPPKPYIRRTKKKSVV
jgi:hypothetical protein